MLSIDCCKLCLHMYVYMAKRVYNVMKTIKYHLLATIRYFAIKGKREQIDSMTFEETPLSQYHYFLFLYVFSYIHCWYLDIVADKRNIVIFAYHPRIYHFIRQFYKKPAGYMCYTFFLFRSLQKQFFFVYFIRAFDLVNWVGIYIYIYT
jgi:hypothetical protein